MTHKIRLVGISGQLNSGKDTVADHLVTDYGFVRVALADPIKRFGYHVFLFTDKQLWGPSSARNGIDHRYTDPNDEAWESARGRLEAYGRQYCTDVLGTDVLGTDVLGTDDETKVTDAYNELVRWFFWLRETYSHELSPRIMLQTLGTEWGRDNVDKDLWLNYMLRTAKTLLHADGSTREWDYDPLAGVIESRTDTHVKGVVVSDVRFENEFKAIRDAGGVVIRINRPDTDAEAATVGVSGHASEAHTFAYENFDFVLNNDSTLQELYSNIDIYMDVFNSSHH